MLEHGGVDDLCYLLDERRSGDDRCSGGQCVARCVCFIPAKLSPASNWDETVVVIPVEDVESFFDAPGDTFDDFVRWKVEVHCAEVGLADALSFQVRSGLDEEVSDVLW